MEIEYIGKTLLIDNSVLVIGDLHLGFEESLREGGVMVPMGLLKGVLEELERVFEHIEKKKENYGKGCGSAVGGNLQALKRKKSETNKSTKEGGYDNINNKIEIGGDMVNGSKRGVDGKRVVDKVVLLGDLKHEFGRNRTEDYKEIGELMNYLRRKCESVWIVKGNHDAVIDNVLKDLERVELKDYFIFDGVCFVHGDKDFPEIHDKSVGVWVVGHGHPAIVLQEKEGSKKEKYKCFLTGRFKGKIVVIVPSFFDVNEGTDPREFGLGLAWDFKLEKFNVCVVEGEESLEVLGFGKLEKLM